MSTALFRGLAFAVLLMPALFAATLAADAKDLTAAAIKPPPKAPMVSADTKAFSRAAERTVLLQQRKEAQQMVRELTERLAGLTDPSARRMLERQVVEAKFQARLRFLRTKASFARGRGEYELAGRIDQVIQNTLQPRFRVPVTTPGKAKGVARKDGQP